MSTEIMHRTSAAKCRLNPGVFSSGNHCRVCEPEHFAPAIATPDPLDPSKVKAGDPVTLTIHDPEMAPFEVQGPAYNGPEGVMAGAWPLVGHPHVTLTAHTPAPEPEPATVFVGDREAEWEALVRKHEEEIVRLRGLNEGYVRDIAQWRQKCEEIEAAVTELAPEPEPEWKPGAVARLSLLDDDLAPRVYRTGIGTWHAIDDTRSWSDADVEHVHEFVVIDPAEVKVGALYEVLSATGFTYDGVRAVLAEVGIEVAR